MASLSLNMLHLGVSSKPLSLGQGGGLTPWPCAWPRTWTFVSFGPFLHFTQSLRVLCWVRSAVPWRAHLRGWIGRGPQSSHRRGIFLWVKELLKIKANDSVSVNSPAETGTGNIRWGLPSVPVSYHDGSTFSRPFGNGVAFLPFVLLKTWPAEAWGI